MATDTVGASTLGLGCPAQLATGAFTSTGNATSLVIGYMPRKVRITNETDNIVWEKTIGQAAVNSVKSTASAQSIDTTAAIGFPIDPGLNEPGNTVLLSAALCGTGKAIVFEVWG